MSNLATVKINGLFYMIELPSYRGRDLVDFSPRATTGGNSLVHSELGLYQVISQDDWRHGFGFPRWITEAGYLRTQGRIDTRHAGMVMMFGESVVSESTTAVIDGAERFNDGNLVVWHDTGLRRYNGTVWDDVSPVVSTKVNYGWTNGTNFFAAVDGDFIYKSTDLSAWSSTGVNSNSKDYAWIHNHNGFVYAGKQGKNEVYYSSDVDLADLAGLPADDPNTIFVGPGGEETVGMTSFLGNAYIFTKQRVWRLNHEQNSATKVLDFTPESQNTSGAAFRPGKWAIHGGQMILCINDVVYQWNGIRLSDITPKRINDSFPYQTHGQFDNLTVVKTDLFMTALVSDGTLKRDLLAWDGVAWYILGTDISQAVTMSFYDPGLNRFWFSGNQGGGIDTRYIQLQSKSKFLDGGFPTTQTHSLFTSKIDAGFRRVKKSTPSILIEASNLDNTVNQVELRVFFSINGGTFQAWGDTDGVTNVVDTNGVTELKDPLGDGTGNSTIEYNDIRLRIDFVTDIATQSPILENFVIRLIMRPDTNFGYGFNVVATEVPDVGGRILDIKQPADIINNLRTARQSKAPVEFVDPFGTTRQVYISALNEQAIELKAETPGAQPNLEHRIFVNVVEV